MHHHDEISGPSSLASTSTATKAILSALSDLCPSAYGLTSPSKQDRSASDSTLTLSEWDEVEQLAMAEQVAPLLYRAWRTRTDLPPAILAQFHQSYLLTALSNELRFRELQPALDALSAAGIQTIILKGAALAVAVYADPGLRPMVDVDLLIHNTDAQKAMTIFEGLGYVVAGAEIHEGATFAYENEIAFVKPGPAPHLLPKIMVEVHWSLFNSPFHQHTLDMDWFWATTQALTFAGQPTLILGAEAQLLHLSAHLWLHHRGDGLLWLHDIAAVIHRYHEEIDWDLLIAQAIDFQVVLPLQQTLPAVAEVWSAPVPAVMLAKLKEMTPSANERRVFNWLTATTRPPTQRFWADLWGQPDWGQRTIFAIRQLFPTPAYMHQRYRIGSPWVLPFLYFYRWLLGLRGAVTTKSGVCE